ncbi:hypothetical protein [Streptomyces sp. NPDC096193]|uniref:hypothetical protein n=1 Tax=Streptomyces sp. NPDC096193 TaxID=3155821 RepID=UPI003318EDFC
MLIVTAAGEWNPHGIEPVILKALIVVMTTTTTWACRHSTRLRDATDRQPYGGDHPG